MKKDRFCTNCFKLCHQHMLFDGQVRTIQCSVDSPPININNDTKSSLLALQKDGKLVQRVLSAGGGGGGGGYGKITVYWNNQLMFYSTSL